MYFIFHVSGTVKRSSSPRPGGIHRPPAPNQTPGGVPPTPGVTSAHSSGDQPGPATTGLTASRPDGHPVGHRRSRPNRTTGGDQRTVRWALPSGQRLPEPAQPAIRVRFPGMWTPGCAAIRCSAGGTQPPELRGSDLAGNRGDGFRARQYQRYLPFLLRPEFDRKCQTAVMRSAKRDREDLQHSGNDLFMAVARTASSCPRPARPRTPTVR